MKTKAIKMQRSIRLSGSIILALLSLSNCSKKSEPQPVTITVNPTSINLPSAGGEQTFTVTTTAAEWSVSVDASWLTASKQNGSVKVEASINPGVTRNATVRCTDGTVSATVAVLQGSLTARQRDSIALVEFYDAASGASWTRKWTLSSPMSLWHGVKISSEGRVEELMLSENNLSGSLPETFGSLAFLKYCDLHGNALTGVIPAGISKLAQLEFLDLSENSFVGDISALNALTGLIALDLSFNDFTVLPTLNALTLLEYLAFGNNRFGGGLPDNLSALTNLIYLDASNNGFSGNIPAAWSSLTKMKVFYLYSNSLGNGIPAYLADFANLEKLALDGNNLTGSIPEALGALSRLEDLHLAQNRLTGSIPVLLLDNPKWAIWKSEICPQQSGYGFENCSGSRSLMQTKTDIHVKNDYKEKYRSTHSKYNSFLE